MIVIVIVICVLVCVLLNLIRVFLNIGWSNGFGESLYFCGVGVCFGDEIWMVLGLGIGDVFFVLCNCNFVL